MGPIVLAKNFPMVAGSGQFFFGDWIPFDSEYQCATLHVHCQTLSPLMMTVGFNVKVETSFDTVEANQVGAVNAVNLPGSQSAAISANLGPLVRLVIENAEAVAMIGVLSVWLQPKSE